MAALDEGKDKKYTNWLLVNLALHYMKSGVHTFIKREFDCLHQSLVQKINVGQTVSLPPCSVCHASRVKRDENGVWAFKKQCRSHCAVWLEELLALHANPKSEEICWNNSNVSSWPFQPWECAKVYMPRGRQFSNSGPAEGDAQSLLILLDRCTHFHPKLSPKGLSLTQTISAVRNKIMHDGEMKLSDADRMNFIQQIIQLLEDPVHLESLDDCKAAVSNIHKIDNDSLDADIEMTAWKAVVNDFRLELGIQEKTTLDTVDSLKKEYEQRREQITKRFDMKKRFEGDVTNKLPIQEDAQSVKSQVNTLVQQEKKHQHMPTTVITHEVKLYTDVEDLDTESQDCKTGILTQGGNNTNSKRKAVGKGISKSGIQEIRYRSVLNRCLPVLLRDLDFKNVSIYIQQKEMFDNGTMCDILVEQTPSEKNRGLIQWIQQRDQATYKTFKECLVLAKQGYIKDMLEEEEERIAINKNKDHMKFLGRGAYGEVYKWYDLKSKTWMAVKEVPNYGSPIEKGIAESLVNEIKILKRLHHDRIIRYYGCSEEETQIQIFMEYMPNGSLKDLIYKYHTPLEEEFVVKVTRHILEGIAYLHENQILHRDIKAHNVLLDSEMNAKLADFGISKELHSLTNSSMHCNTYIGTPYWMSPERVRGEKYGRSADIWSIGCTTVEMITMNPPWFELDIHAAIYQIGKGEYPKYQLPSMVSPHVEDLLSQTFQQEASKRPTALELLSHPFIR